MVNIIGTIHISKDHKKQPCETLVVLTKDNQGMYAAYRGYFNRRSKTYNKQREATAIRIAAGGKKIPYRHLDKYFGDITAEQYRR